MGEHSFTAHTPGGAIDVHGGWESAHSFLGYLYFKFYISHSVMSQTLLDWCNEWTGTT